MTHNQLQTFVSAVNAALPADVELRIELVDKPRGVVHLRLDRTEGKPSALQFSFGTLETLMADTESAAWYMQRMFN